jgi:hypothetical protein
MAEKISKIGIRLVTNVTVKKSTLSCPKAVNPGSKSLTHLSPSYGYLRNAGRVREAAVALSLCSQLQTVSDLIIVS